MKTADSKQNTSLRGKTALNSFIFRHYAKSALIPILSIELILLIVYFGVNWYTNSQAEQMLKQEVTSIMPHIVQKQADLINGDFTRVAEGCKWFAESNEALFAHPENFSIIGEQPRFETAPTGALYQVNRDTASSLYYIHADKLTPAQREKARITAALDPLYRHLVKDIPNVAAAYLNTPDDMNRLYPFIPEVYKQYPPELNMEEYNFYYLADKKHNPEKKAVWTGVYLDPAGQGWMLSCVAPVYHADTLAGVVGLDMTIANIVERVLSQEIPWGGTAFLADDSGMILAMSPKAEQILGLTELKKHVYSSSIKKEQLKPEEFNLFKSRNTVISKAFKDIYASADAVHQIRQENSSDLFVISGKISAAKWKLFILVDSKEVLESVEEVKTLSHRIGLVIVAGMLVFYLFFFLFLRKQAAGMSVTMAKPVTDLSDAARILGSGTEQNTLAYCGISELDELTSAFIQMADQLDERSRALVAGQVQIKIREKEAELAFAQGMFEAAGGYLHNVGNSITHLDSALLDLDSVLKGTEQYPAVFDKIQEGDLEVLKRFRAVLLDKSVPKITETVTEIRRIKESIQQTIRHQQQSFKDARQTLSPVKFDLAELVREVAAKADAGERIELISDLPESLPIVHHRNQLSSGIFNLIKNSIESCAAHDHGTVRITLKENESGAVLTVEDDGAGVKPEHMSKIMSAGFTTKPNGNGFGLHSFAVFLSAHSGKVALESEGPDCGARVTVEVNYVKS